jgi:probable HAF family extracellular repeat protein
MRLASTAALAATFVGAPAAMAQSASFQGLGDVSGGAFFSQAAGVSADGNVVVGSSTAGTGTEAFRWTSAGGMAGLGDLPGGGTQSRAFGTSADGSVVVGHGVTSEGDIAFRWTQSGGMVGLGLLPGGSFGSYAHGVSAAGAVVAGRSQATGGLQQAFRWTQSSGMVALPGREFGGEGYAISADGTTIVGRVLSSVAEAALWDSTGQLVVLGDLPGGATEAFALGASGNGSVVVGYGVNSAGREEAFRWTAAGGMVALGGLPGAPFVVSRALAVSGDGSVVVGRSLSASGLQAFVWTSAGGMRSLRDILVDQGVDVTGWTLTEAAAISGDGRVVAGYGTNPQGQTEAFRAVIGGGHRWIDPTGGSWDVASNWAPATVPGPNDPVSFDLDATYTVTGGTTAHGGATARAMSADDGTVDFDMGGLALTSTATGGVDGPPSLSVSFDATAKIIAGTSTFVNGIVGYGSNAPQDTTTTARLQVFNAGTNLSGQDLIIGLQGRAEAFVAAGTLNAFSTSIGGDPSLTGAPAGIGELIVGNTGTFNTSLLFVADEARGTLRVEAGGAATAVHAEVGGTSAGIGGLVVVTGFQPTLSRFFVTDTLEIGSSGPGTLRIREAGEVTAGTVVVGTTTDGAGTVDVDGVFATLIASAIAVGTGGADASLEVKRGAIVEASRLVLGGAGGVGVASVGPESPDAPAILGVARPGFTGECQIGGPGSTLGWLTITGGGWVECDQATVAASGGNGLLEVRGTGAEFGVARITVSRVLTVGVSGSGDVDLGGGRIDAVNAAASPPADPDDVVVGANGRILGTGTVIGAVRASGTIGPGVQVVPPPEARAIADRESDADRGAPGGALQVSGRVVFEPGSVLEVPLAAPDTTSQGRLRVVGAHGMDGSAALAGTLRLAFQNGYAPQAGDTFTLLDAASTTGAFAATEVTGLEPGWLFELEIVNGTVVLNSLSDGVPTTPAEPGAPAASGLVLHPPVPNPTAGATMLRFDLAAAGDVHVEVFDALGRRVAVLLDGHRPAGAHTATLDAGRLAPGVYVARIRADGATASRAIAVAR